MALINLTMSGDDSVPGNHSGPDVFEEVCGSKALAVIDREWRRNGE